LLAGAGLGVFCIIGVGYRLGFSGHEFFLFGVWYNRVLMGLLIGLAPGIIIAGKKFNFLVRGLLLGFIVSFSLLIVTDFRDPIGFIAGIIYGPIIDYFATKYSK
jgi:hypothetical protein